MMRQMLPLYWALVLRLRPEEFVLEVHQLFNLRMVDLISTMVMQDT